MTNLQKWFLIIGMWAVILTVIFGFYWTQVRPARIRRLCSAYANKSAAEIKSGIPNMLDVSRAVYSDCLKRNGIER
jgi:hypothetical protein